MRFSFFTHILCSDFGSFFNWISFFSLFSSFFSSDFGIYTFMLSIFPQQRKLTGSSAQNSSGVQWCRRRRREGSEGSGEGLGGFGAEPGQVQQGSGNEKYFHFTIYFERQSDVRRH